MSGRQTVSGIGVFSVSVIFNEVKGLFEKKHSFLLFVFSVWMQQAVGHVRCGVGLVIFSSAEDPSYRNLNR